VNIQETRRCNLYNLGAVARYYDVDEKAVIASYEELLDDNRFLNDINEKITSTASTGFKKAIFGKGPVDTVDWFAFQRVLLYVLLRLLRPQWCLETGVYYGGNSAFILTALHHNGAGELISIDLPDSRIRSSGPLSSDLARHPLVGDSELYDETLKPGFIIPDYLRSRWTFIEGNSLTVIPTLTKTFDFYIHDSDHSFDFLTRELGLTQPRMSAKGTIIVDDINWSNAFFKFCVDNRYYPLCLTDNGKDNLNVRTGLVYLQHSDNRVEAVVGRASE
jgi:Methyltransferase domain